MRNGAMDKAIMGVGKRVYPSRRGDPNLVILPMHRENPVIPTRSQWVPA